jgi:hypothetical protein
VIANNELGKMWQKSVTAYLELTVPALDCTEENHETRHVTDLPFYVFILVVCWAPVDLDPREMVTPGSFNR